LAVAARNRRAIRAYERAGFRRGEAYPHRTNGGEHRVLRMERPARRQPPLAADLDRRRPRLGLLQGMEDLLLGKPALLHRRPSFRR